MTANDNATFCLSGRDPITIASTNVCNPGFYCPNNTVDHPPQYCPPTDECLLTRLREEGGSCRQPQGMFEPTICPSKYYCPEGGKQLIPCPKNSYCPLGSIEPRKCLPLSVCPDGSDHEIPLVGLLCCGLFDLVLLLMSMLPWLRREWHRENGQLHDDERMDMHSSGFDLVPGLRDGGLQHTPAVVFKNVSLSYPASKEQILSGVNGRAPGGSFLGIMGGSGSGKTSLVNILAGKTKATSGSLLVNGIETSLTDLKRPKGLFRFVPQDDIVHCHLTVRENILHSARVQLGGISEDKAIQEHVENVIRGLGLWKVRDTIVGDHQRRGVSGGERKRVSIGIELVAAPRILILDEPTSGLDALAALSIIKLLKSLSQSRITVICVIHQPRVEIFNELDSLLLLNAGKQAFLGKASNAQRYFESQGYRFDPHLNPADVIMDIIAKGSQVDNAISCLNRHRVEDSESKVVAHNLVSDNESCSNESPELQSWTEPRRRMASWHRQAYLCFSRDILQQSRQVNVFVTEIWASIVTGLLIGLAVYKMRGQIFLGVFHPPFRILSSATNYEWVPRVALLVSFAISFVAAPPSVGIIAAEGLVFQREAYSGHSASAYFAGKVLSSLLRSTLPAFHFTSFYMVLATPFVSFGKLLGLHLLHFYCIYGIGSVVASFTKVENGPLVCLLVCLIISVFGGTAPRLKTVKEWNLAWIWYLSPCLWLSEAYYTEHVTPFGYLFDVRDAETFTGYTLNRAAFDAGLILAIGTLYRALGCVLIVARARLNWQ